MKKIKKVHLIGVGGIGVSALARYYIEKGCQVSGSDLVSSEITEALKKKGVKIFIGKERPENLSKKFDLIIYSPAVKVGRRTSNILSYPEALGELTKKYFTIAVSGTHGKSTTTAMVGLVLVKAGLDPTVIVGTKVKEFGDSNCRVGKSKYLVIEADEHFASFLNYWPKIVVLTNIEKDHLDYYKNFKNILKAFREYIRHLPKDGVLIANKDDKNIEKLISQRNAKSMLLCSSMLSTRNIETYSLSSEEARELRKILKVPGEHNVYNALAALTMARVLKIPDKISFKALSEYKGSWRRFEEKELKIDNWKLKIISDYAHHPTEIKATIKACRERFSAFRIWAIFQPHQYQRTYYLFKDFVKAFDEADQIVLSDIYDVAGREEKEISKKVDSKKLAEAIKKRGKKVYYIGDFKKILNFLRKRVKPNDVILVMGAGDIYKLVNSFPQGWS